jgi:hypothetical protein
MPRPMSRPACWPALLLLVIGYAGPVVAQVRVERPPPGATNPTPVGTVASLTAEGGRGSIVLDWPAASGVPEYWVTRVDNKGSQEATIYRGPPQNFVFEGKECTPTSVANALKNCIYEDKGLSKGVLYSYRVWTGSGPSPVASARVK